MKNTSETPKFEILENQIDNSNFSQSCTNTNDNKDEQIKEDKPKKKGKKTFEEIKGSDEYNKLSKKENKIRKDNLIKGIARKLKSGDSTDNEKAPIII